MNIHERLRSETAAKHKNLETEIDSHQLMASPEKNHYARILQTHLAYHRFLNKVVADRDLEVLDWGGESPRIRSIESDLNALGYTPRSHSHDSESFSDAFVFGLCYVAEGSQLGNKMMLNQLKKNPTFSAWNATGYFGYEDEVYPRRWQTFLEMLKVLPEEAGDEVINGANYGFDLFLNIWQGHTVKT